MRRVLGFVPYIIVLLFLAGCAGEGAERGEGELLYRAAGAAAGNGSPAATEAPATDAAPAPAPQAPTDEAGDPAEPPAPSPAPTDENTAPAAESPVPAPTPPADNIAPAHPSAWRVVPRAGGIPPVASENAAYLRPFSAVYRGAELAQVFLTFELAYEAGYTEALLDTLAAHSARAAFFVTHAYFVYNGDLITRMMEEGHIVGLRTMQPLTELTDDEISDALLYPWREFSETFGRALDPFLRPAEGAFDERTLTQARHYGFFTVFWSAVHGDWAQGAAYAHPGMVLSLPGVNAANIAALPATLTALRDAGFAFATLYELI